jgi:hypothetical protein
MYCIESEFKDSWKNWFMTHRFLYTLSNDQLINGFEMEVSGA